MLNLEGFYQVFIRELIFLSFKWQCERCVFPDSLNILWTKQVRTVVPRKVWQYCNTESDIDTLDSEKISTTVTTRKPFSSVSGKELIRIVYFASKLEKELSKAILTSLAYF